jgi:hypothetical protein
VPTYVRTFRPERHPHRRRRRPDADAARRSYTELAADGTPLRHIEMRADDGTYLSAAAGGPPPPPGSEEITAEQFEELWRLARCQLDGVVQIQIHEVRPQAPHGLPVVVRCLGGRVRPGSRFDQSRNPADQIEFTVTRIERPGGEVTELTPPHSALLILTGTGRLQPNQTLTGK